VAETLPRSIRRAGVGFRKASRADPLPPCFPGELWAEAVHGTAGLRPAVRGVDVVRISQAAAAVDVPYLADVVVATQRAQGGAGVHAFTPWRGSAWPNKSEVLNT
jgi:hypothetical protein